MTRKRTVIWAALAALALLFAGAKSSFLMGQAGPTVVKQGTARTSQVGRYQIFSNPNVRADTFLLDTQTGNTWTPIEITNVKGRPTIWKFQERVDNNQQFLEWSARQQVESSNQNDK